MKDKLVADGFLASQPSKGAVVVYERSVTPALVEGRLFGTTTGQVGAYDSGDAHAVESYHGRVMLRVQFMGRGRRLFMGLGRFPFSLRRLIRILR